MNAPFTAKPDPLAIPEEHIHAAIAALVALQLRPRRDNFAWYRALKTFDQLEGCDALLEPIENLEHDLGLSDSECLACGANVCGCDQAYGDRVSWGLTSEGSTGVWA